MLEQIKDYQSVLGRYFMNKKLVLFLGSGFTVNEKSSDGYVLDGSTLQKIMIDSLIDTRPSLDRNLLEKDSFSDIADSYFQNVKEDKIETLLKKHFTGVKMQDQNKVNILKFNWPYIYTLNIYDGIENNSEYKKILPNKEIKSTYLSEFKFVFKLHGDALDAILYKDSKGVIFSKGQYVKSIKTNQSLLSKLKADYIQNNILFVGCSLQDEIDLRLIIEELRDEGNGETNDLIIVTHNEFDENKKMKLEALGINKYIIEQYDVFYNELNTVLSQNKIERDGNLKQFKNLSIKMLANNYESNLKTLYRDYSYEMINTKAVTLPFYLIKREIEHVLESFISRKHPFFYIIGKRCSGKTLIVFSIIKKLANMDSYYFPSKMSLSNETVNTLLSLKNTLLVFDSNSITSEQISRIQGYESQIKRNNISCLFIVNASDRILASLMISYFGENEIEINNKFSAKETSEVNVKISKCKIANFDPANTIIDNIIRIESTYGIINKHIDLDIIHNISENDLIILLLLLTYSKIFFSELLLYEIPIKEMNIIPKRFSPFIDLEDTSLIENSEHSTTKLVSSSTIGLVSILNSYYNANTHGRSRIISSIKKIVSISVRARSNKYKNVIMFDNLNQIFSYHFKGAKKLILDLYSEIESLISSDSHYWIQRAKSIYHMEPDNVNMLRDAKIFALKAYSDSEKGSRLNTISMFTLARIIGRIVRIKDYTNINEVEESINYYYRCLIDNPVEDEYSKDLLDEAIKRRNRSDLYHLVIYNPITKISDFTIKQELTALYNLILNK